MSKNASEGSSQSGEGQNNSGEGSGVSIQDLQNQLNDLKASNERLLTESKTWKSKYQSVGSEAEERERAQAEKSKDHEKLLNMERKRVNELQTKLKARDESTLQANIKATVAKFAPDAVDLDDLLNQPKFSAILKGGVDEDALSVSEEAAKLFVSEVYKAKPYLRKQGQRSSTVQKVPNGRTAHMGFEVSEDLSKKSDAELVGMFLPIE